MILYNVYAANDRVATIRQPVDLLVAALLFKRSPLKRSKLMKLDNIILNRFWAKVDKTSNCWNWIAATDKDGYGVFNDSKRKYVKAHRFSYEIVNGEIPKGNLICHHCDNPACVNPKHLYLGTYKTNAQDMARRGRMKKQNGTDNHMAVLDWKSVNQIRKMWKSGEYTQKEIAIRFGVSRGCITGIIYNVNWKVK